MEKSTTVKLDKGLALQIKKHKTAKSLMVTLTLNSQGKCLLHWGVSKNPKAAWQLPPEAAWPPDTNAVSHAAVQTAFTVQKTKSRIQLKFPATREFSSLSFVLFFPDEDRWDNNNGKNYCIKLPQAGESLFSPTEVLRKELSDRQVLFRQTYHLAGTELAAAVILSGEHYLIKLYSDITGRLALHWGINKKSRYEWLLPPEHLRPRGTITVDDKAAQSDFVQIDGLNQLQLEWPADEAVQGLTFVLHQLDTGQWFKPERNFFIPVKNPPLADTALATAELAEIADQIIQVETGGNSWTLMHRFNLAHDLLDRIGTDSQGLALLFVWLRFSAIRQLDWQRKYNTQPRELTHAQQRLTMKLADCYRHNTQASRELIRLILSTVGRGGEGGRGQRIRDDILQIMHRHKIKEVTGHFMEEWHQKLHNNATPDDIVICEAYLAFLRSNGQLDIFYKTLAEGGISKERLETFERPIVTAPDFVPYIKNGLIADFEKYLQLLKSIYSATDLFSAAEAAGHCLDDQLRDRLWRFYNDRDNMNITVMDQVRSLTSLRHGLIDRLHTNPDTRCLRDLLYLDLALEEFLRLVIERRTKLDFSQADLVELLGSVLDNLIINHDDESLSSCFHHWRRLRESDQSEREWVLHAGSVLDRVTEALGGFIDYYHALLQAKAEHLGQAFQADKWTVDLFSQEVIRGSSAYVLSTLLRRLAPILRAAAQLGSWQVISPGEVSGKVEAAELSAVQARVFKKPAVLLSETIKGEEEVPEGVVAVITPAEIDILSHVSVRSRNAGILFATCYEPEIFNDLKSYQGKNIKLTINSSGEVEYQPQKDGAARKKSIPKAKLLTARARRVTFTSYAAASKNFTTKIVGGKSLKLQELKDKIPAWLHIPRSAAIPFRSCERVLAIKANQPLLKDYNELTHVLDQNPPRNLLKLRQCISRLNAPPTLPESLRRAMADEGLAWPDDWPLLWSRIKQIWASKWNERAYWSRKKWHLKHEELTMAVLIQEVVAAQYAFVIHTANPFTFDKNELYAEVVLGLGETLCSGNYPGRALSFTCRKDKKSLDPYIISYPGKSLALTGGGLIVRSDSNGEDLEGYAGAGLYDSVLLVPPQEKTPDYINSPLLWQADFRTKFLQDITRLGIEVEKSMEGCPQDIEGAYADGKFYIVQTRPQVGNKND
ncbi:Phosphoenolpyruvate synthase [hydrothermal vent metagenome]|uniref:Phosphoenolpyruvate synthase n=1 Tax=hydrothermal vent metagenome TaxID=652676 RepID=A0A3B0W1M9_9ZZZZ